MPIIPIEENSKSKNSIITKGEVKSPLLGNEAQERFNPQRRVGGEKLKPPVPVGHAKQNDKYHQFRRRLRRDIF